MSTSKKIGVLAVAAAISLAALAVVLVARTGETATTRVANAPLELGTTATELGAPIVDYTIDLNTGVMTPLPEPIIRSVAKSGKSGLPRYAASPDGSQLAYVGTGDEGSPQIFVAGIDGTAIRQVTHDPEGTASPAWSPDGRKIAYEGYSSAGARKLFVLDVATGEPTPIAGAGTVRPWSQPTFTPDGVSLVYTRGPNCCPVIWTVPVAGGESTILFGRGRGGMGGAAGGSLSPDGSLVTMMGNEPGGPGALRFVANADGTGLRSISGRASNPAGTWSPDGSRIVCSADEDRELKYSRQPARGISVVDVATGGASVVATGSAAIWLDGHTLLVEV